MLNRESLLFSPTRDGVPSSDDDFSAADIAAAQTALEEEAREAIPYSHAGGCTYDQGYVRQPVFACKTCLNYAGVCASCSIACHGEHELVELFMRRDFRCDCGTEKMGAGSCCAITRRTDAPPNRNKYDKSFKGSFCICAAGNSYDPFTETDEMMQCLVCEDWLHNACLLGSHADTHEAPLGPDDFDMLVCARCVQTNSGVRRVMDRWAGVEGSGVMVVSKDDVVLGRTHLEDEQEEEEGEGEGPGSEGETLKRKAANGDAPWSPEGPSAKRAKTAPDTGTPSSSDQLTSSARSIGASTEASSTAPDACIAPPFALEGESVLSRLERDGARMNVYLEEGWIERWCRCSKCINNFISFPYFLEEEENVEPPDDPDAQKSTMELGMEALDRMPRAAGLDASVAYKNLESKLKAFLQPVAASGRSVTKEDIASFFEMMQEERRELGVGR